MWVREEREKTRIERQIREAKVHNAPDRHRHAHRHIQTDSNTASFGTPSPESEKKNSLVFPPLTLLSSLLLRASLCPLTLPVCVRLDVSTVVSS
jgi:hypothetical protein